MGCISLHYSTAAENNVFNDARIHIQARDDACPVRIAAAATAWPDCVLAPCAHGLRALTKSAW